MEPTLGCPTLQVLMEPLHPTLVPIKLHHLQILMVLQKRLLPLLGRFLIHTARNNRLQAPMENHMLL